MSDTVLARWSDEVRISQERWEQAREHAFQEVGIDSEASSGGRLSMFTPAHQVYEPGGFHNWTRLLPEDSIRRVRQTEALGETVLELSRELHEAIESTSDGSVTAPITQSEMEPSDYLRDDLDEEAIDSLLAGQLAYLASQIVGQFSGNVDLDRIAAEETLVSRDESAEPPDHETTVLVHRRNERNFEDIAAFTVENGTEFFGDRFGDSTAMFDAMRRANLEPDFVASNVAFNGDGNSWGKSAPPEGPISIMYQDHKNRVDFTEVPDPQRVFHGSWGDIGEMMNALGKDDYTHRYDAGGTSWQLVLGV